MKLSKLSIQNYARLTDFDLEIRRHLVLVGPNDVGKSSLLKCLDLVMGASSAAMYSRVSPADFRDPSQPLVVEVALTDFSAVDRQFFPDEITVVGSNETLLVRLEATLEADETLQIRRSAPDGGTGRQLTREQVAALGWKFVSATQSSIRDFRDERNDALEDILSAVDLGAERQGLADVADSFQEKLSSSGVLGGLRAQLAEQLSKAVPSRVQEDDLQFVTSSSATDDLLADVRLQILRNGIPRNLSEQSDGARALFAIAMYDLVAAAANVVAIDEPEVHLHPASQRSLARLLKAGVNQKVLATHSADIVGAFDPDDIAVVRIGGIVTQPTAGFLAAKSKLQAHWWVNGRLEPLTSTRIILVEGISDRLVVQRAAELTDRDLDRAGVSMMEIGGILNVAPVVRVFGPDGFNVPLSILIDEDGKSDPVGDLGLVMSVPESPTVFVSVRDLEAEYVTAIGADECFRRLEVSGEFKKNQLALCGATGPNGTRLAADVAAFCRRNSDYKVRAALVIAATLTEDEARAITSVESLLDSLGV